MSLNSPGTGWVCPYQQRSEDLPQCVCVQAVVALCLGDLSQVSQEVLQGEVVVERHTAGVLQDLAHLSAPTACHSAIWEKRG